ncbi:MAG: SsrA-binding protein SmpB [Alphaproteobacteria bacterium]|nr:SsrA-binding protein SmpB [Alphaproteobacteria bacterium]
MVVAKGAPGQVVAQNRKARHNYFIEETLEAGIMLQGSEVKSLRAGKASIGEAFASEREGEIWLLNAHISPYEASARFNHEPLRPRKLLLRKREVDRLLGAVRRKGVTLVPLAIYFNERGIAKVSLGVAAGKKKHDKRATEKERDWQRQRGRLLRDKG